MAIRRGQLAALITALLSMLALNYLFVAPRHQFTIAHRQDVAQLVVLLIAAVVVGRLAAASRARAAEAEQRAALAARREREAKLLAEASSAILAGANVAVQSRDWTTRRILKELKPKIVSTCQEISALLGHSA